MDLIIGRESGSTAPRLCIKQGDKVFYLGAPGSVPKTVSRSHCRLQIDGDDRITISNISDQNSLFINGLEYKTKMITKNDLVELGAEHYQLDVQAILAMLKRLPARPISTNEPPTYHIAHLRTVWEDYSKNRMDIQVSQGKFNAASTIPGVLSMVSIALSFVFTDVVRVVFISIAAILAIAFAIVRLNNADKIPMRQKALDDKFQDDYVCPHCKHFMGNQSYKLILKNGGCPWCKSKFTE